MSFDISELELGSEPIDVPSSEYVAPSSGTFEPVPAGIYVGTLIPGKFKDRETGRTGTVRFGVVKSKQDNGKPYLSAEIASRITEGEYQGRLLFGRVNTIPYKFIFKDVEKGRENANAFMDLLRAAGYDGPLASNQDYSDAIQLVVGEERPGRISTDWSWYCNPNSTEYRGDGKTIRGMKKNASTANDAGEPLPDGQYNPRLQYTTEFGETVTLLAKNELKAFYPPKKG